ncbi:MAG: type II secretion system protein [Candidatus Kaiserbacteria bacterium]|nr:type II secretion system protein [Candidatus Kaiserbacteria bacterium]
MTSSKETYRRWNGFTLIELLVVVAILGVLAGIVVVPLTGKTFDARHAALNADMQVAKRVIHQLIATDEVHWRSCMDDSDAGKTLRRLIQKYDTDDTSLLHYYHPDCELTDITLFSTRNCGNYISSAYVVNAFDGSNDGSGMGVTRFGSNINISLFHHGCISTVGGGDAVGWKRGNDFRIMFWLTDTNAEGDAVVKCVDYRGFDGKVDEVEQVRKLSNLLKLPSNWYQRGIDIFFDGADCCMLFWQGSSDVEKCRQGYRRALDKDGQGIWIK